MKTVAVIACSVLLMASTETHANRFDGTWKTDSGLAKLPDRPEVFLLEHGTYTCKSCVPPFAIVADGLPHKVAGNPYFDSASMRVVDGNTFQVDHLKAGKVISRGTLAIGADGRTMTDDFSHIGGTSEKAVTGHLTAKRVASGPTGSTNLSGAWQIISLSEADTDRTFTLKTAGDMLLMSRPSGQSFHAGFSGQEAPYMGDPGITAVRVRRLAEDEIEETDLRNKLVVGITTMTLSHDGKVLNSVHLDKLHGFSSAATAYKQ